MKFTTEQVLEIHNNALVAAKKACDAYEASNHWYPCGFANLKFTKGNANFVNQLKKLGIGRKPAVGSGYTISANLFSCTQSMYAKEAGFNAYMDHLMHHDVHKSVGFYLETRID